MGSGSETRERKNGTAPGRRERNKLEKRARIVSAARALFRRKGFAETTTQQIAEAADIGTGTLFLYANSKEDLLVMVFKDEMLETIQAIFASLSPQAPVLERLVTVFNQMADYHAADIDLSRILMREVTVPRSPERASDIADLMDAIHEGLTDIVSDRPAAAPGSAYLIARSAFGLYFLALLSWLGNGLDRTWCMRLLREQLSLLLGQEASA